ncbi:MAG TPA: VWA domain-containing protein [Bryobacteraceae bacterium]|nr:VWA domain-containing protein [Bryobacteraceae bacterium]
MRTLLTILAAGLLAAQQPQELPTIKIDVNVVNLLCSVRDSRNALVGNLGRDDFLVTEEGKAQEIRYFEKETDLPLTIGLLVDVSASQRNLIPTQRQAAERFFSSVLRKRDMAFLISFGSEAELLQDYTDSVVLLREALDQLRLNTPPASPMPGPVPTIYTPRGTILFDAVYLATSEKLRSEVGRKAVVIITDGVDQGSRLKLADAIEAAQKADAIIYSIYYVDPRAYGSTGLLYLRGNGDLRKMSEQTGGRMFEVGRKNTLEDIFRQIQEEMRSQYAIGYVSTNTARDGSYRRVDVRTKQKGLKVQARKGYYAPAS